MQRHEHRKRAKALRRLARARTTGRSGTAYKQVARGDAKHPAQVRVVDPACTRGVYRALKKKERRS